MKSNIKRLLVFGIFDGVHPGHVDFFRQAKKHGDFLVVAVGRPEASRKFKNKLPKHSLRARLRFVRNTKYVDKAIAGDREHGCYNVILLEKPGAICLGYDQKELAHDLKNWLGAQNLKIELKVLRPHKPHKYHSSILNG